MAHGTGPPEVTVPRVSIVIVTWNNEGYIAQAMESCLWSSRPEVIVVHNASTDGTGQVIAAVSARHPGRFRVIENATNIGLGPGRNVGVSAASGDYLVFLDGDDWFLPGASDHLAVMLADRPDLAIFNHRLVWEDGRTQAPKRAGPLSPAGDASAPQARSALVDVLSVAWNKAFRRDWFNDHALGFPPGLYEDIPVHIAALALADRIVRSPEVLVAYRQRDGSITRRQGPEHMDMLDRLTEVRDFAALRPNRPLDRAACVLAQRKVFFLLTEGARLPASLLDPFLRQGLALLAPWRRRVGLPSHDAAMIVARLIGAGGLIAAYRLRRRLFRARRG